MKLPIEYYPNGQKRWEGGYFDNFDYTGNFFKWYESGNKESESIDIYFDGTLYLYTAWYENGQMMSRGKQSDCTLCSEVGLWTTWYENGNKKSEGFYRDRHTPSGEWKYWHSNGQLACTGIHSGNKEYESINIYFEGWAGDGLWVFWDEAGNKIHEREYMNCDFLNLWDNLRADGCSDELVYKYKMYIYKSAWCVKYFFKSEVTEETESDVAVRKYIKDFDSHMNTLRKLPRNL
jgi:hypothetical protein